jgi:hypothetical protein
VKMKVAERHAYLRRAKMIRMLPASDTDAKCLQ